MSTIRVDNIQSTTGTSGLQVDDDGGLTVGALNTGSLAGFRNRIINGNAVVAQRGPMPLSGSTTGKIYTFDRWVMGVQPGDNWGADYGDQREERNSMSFNVTGGTWDLGQYIEYTNCWDMGGKTVTFSYWAKAAFDFTANPIFGFYDTATDSQIAGSGTPFSGSADITTSWQYFTHTFTCPSVPPLSGYLNTWAGSIGWNSLPQNCTLQIQDVQFEIGSTATPFERRPIGIEQILCDRYYQGYNLASSQSGYADVGGQPAAVATFVYRQSMRIIPTRFGGQSGGVNVSIASVNVTNKVLNIVGLSLVAGFVYYNYNILSLDAEL